MPFSAFASEPLLNVYGYVAGYTTPQPLTLTQVQNLKTWTYEKTPTWLALMTDMETEQPKLHIIDTEHFQNLPTDYGIHQAYAQEMGIVSGASDFIARLKADGRPRSIMPFTFYVPTVPIDKLAANHQWVLSNRRYIFKDSSAEFAMSLANSQQIFQNELIGILSGPPLFITYKQGENSNRRPNLLTEQGLQDIEALRYLGFSVITEDELADHAGVTPAQVTIHNSNGANEAFGYIKVVHDEAQLEELTPQHIAIFPVLPDRIPPVAAILTLENQTSLSHINVLAINRGTLNIAVSQRAENLINTVLESSEKFKDEPVILKVAGDNIDIQRAQDDQVVKFQQTLKSKIGAVQTPRIIDNGNPVVVKASSRDSTATIGAKAANYGQIERLLGRDFVKPGYAIGFSLYRQVVTARGNQSIENKLIRPLIQKVRRGKLSPQEINRELENIRLAIHNSKLPEATVRSLRQLANSSYLFLGDEQKIRFRSSTNCEDLPRFNGAGLYLSKGIKVKHLRRSDSKTKSLEKLQERLLSVLGSLWLPQAFWEREYFSIDHLMAGMAIQINPSFSNEWADGVIIGSKKDDSHQFWINSQFGEASVTNPKPGEVPESIKLSLQKTNSQELNQEILNSAQQIQSQSNLGSIFLNQSGTLDANKVELLNQLLSSTQLIWTHIVSDPEQYGIDIEFKIMEKEGALKPFIKQARPIYLSH